MYVIATSFQSFSLHLTLGMDGSQGTGSYPLPPHGWHLSTLLTASHNPLKGPCFISACRAYSEQVGVNLHAGGVKGDIHRW